MRTLRRFYRSTPAWGLAPLAALLMVGCLDNGPTTPTSTVTKAITSDEVAECVVQWEACEPKEGPECEALIKQCLEDAYDYDFEPPPEPLPPSPCADEIDECLQYSDDPEACFLFLEQCEFPEPPPEPWPCFTCDEQLEGCLAGAWDDADPAGAQPNDIEQACFDQYDACIADCDPVEPPPEPEPGDCAECDEALNHCLEEIWGPDGVPFDPEAEWLCFAQFEECMQACEPVGPPPEPWPCFACEEQLEGCLQAAWSYDDPSGAPPYEAEQACLDQFDACIQGCDPVEPPPEPGDCTECDEALNACLEAIWGPDGVPVDPEAEWFCFDQFDTCMLECFGPAPGPQDPAQCEELASHCFEVSQGAFDDLCEIVFITCLESSEPNNPSDPGDPMPVEPEPWPVACDLELEQCLQETPPEEHEGCFEAHMMCLEGGGDGSGEPDPSIPW